MKRLFAGVVLITAMFTQACSPSSAVESVVTGFTLETYVQGADNWIQAIAEVNVGSFQLPAFNVPLADPTNMQNSYGNLAFVPGQCDQQTCTGKGNLVISVNLSKATSLPNTSLTLPNATPLPVSGIQNARGIAIPIADTGAKTYLALGQGVTLLGAAIPFSALDPAGKIVPGVNLFVPLNFNKVNVTAGMFFGAETNTTGFGIFVDLSSIVKLSDELRKYGQGKNHLILRGVRPSNAEEKQIGDIMKELESKKTELRLKK